MDTYGRIDEPNRALADGQTRVIDRREYCGRDWGRARCAVDKIVLALDCYQIIHTIHRDLAIITTDAFEMTNPLADISGYARDVPDALYMEDGYGGG